MIEVVAQPDNWPQPDDYERWQKGTMSRQEQIIFFACLREFAGRYARHIFRTLVEADREEIANDAVYDHARTFRVGHGKGRAHLRTILVNKGRDLLNAWHRNKEVPYDDLALANGDDFLDRNPDSNLLESTAREENIEHLVYLWKNREKLPPYPWRDTFFLFLEWTLFENGGSIDEFCYVAEGKYGLILGKSTIYRHIDQGTKQLAKWFSGEDKIPLESVRKVIKCNPTDNQVGLIK